MQPVHVGDHPRGEPRGLLPDVAGGACERSRLQHPAAAEHRRAPTDDYQKPRPSPVPCVRSSRQPDVDALPLDRKHNGEEGRGKAMESNLNLNFQTFKPASLHFQQNADYKISTETKRKFNKFRFVITKLINMNVQKIVCITKCSSLEERRCDTPAKKTIKQMIPSDVFS